MIKIATKGIKDFNNNYSYFRVIDYVLINDEDIISKEYKDFVKQKKLPCSFFRIISHLHYF